LLLGIQPANEAMAARLAMVNVVAATMIIG